MKNIGIDLDHTLTTWKLLFWEVAYELCGCDVPPPLKPQNYGLRDFPVDVQEMCMRLFSCKWYMVDLLEPYIDAYQFLMMVNKSGCSVNVITCRPKSVRDATRSKVREFFDNFVQTLHFVDKHEDKKELFRDLKLDMWIDDHPLLCSIAADMGIRVFMRQQPWNMSIPTDHEKITKIVSLNDIDRGEFTSG